MAAGAASERRSIINSKDIPQERIGRKEHYRLLPLIDANFLETNPAPVKAVLHGMGKIQNILRLPLMAVSDATYAKVNDTMARISSTSASVSSR